MLFYCVLSGPDSFPLDPEYERLEAEFQRHEEIMAAINDPTTQEGKVAQHAATRLQEIVNEAELDLECLELATQVCSFYHLAFLPYDILLEDLSRHNAWFCLVDSKKNGHQISLAKATSHMPALLQIQVWLSIVKPAR